jgi:hypothetical protein
MEEDPERIGNARWTFERFMSHASSKAGGLYPKFVHPLVGALEATEEETARLFLAWGEDATGSARRR